MAFAAERLLNGRYRIGELLGEGAAATVSRALDELLGRDVAIKILKPVYAEDERTVDRFHAEARAVAALGDRNIVGLYDMLADGPVHAIVMEYVDGPSLADVLRREGTVDESRAVAYARQIARALSAAHSRGILHRDIKPANVLLTHDDVVKVADFGLAKAVAGSDLALTEAGRLVGSAYYFSPEQAQGLPLSPASDLYSLGVVLHQLVTGTLPFEATSPVSMAVAHVTEPSPSEAALSTAMSPGLASIVHRLLRKDPHERFASAADLDAALGALAESASGTGAAWDSPTASWDGPTIVGLRPRDGSPAGGEPVTPPRKRPKRRRSASTPFRARIEPALAQVRSVAARIPGAVSATFATAGERAASSLAAAGRSPSVRGAAMRYGAIAGVVVLVLFVLGLSARSRAVVLADVRHTPLAHARTTLASLGLTPSVTNRVDETVRAGTVVDEAPRAGSTLHRGDIVHLTVSSSAPLVTVPDFRGMSYAGARAAVARTRLRAQYAAQVSDAPPNTVIEQFPAAGAQVKHGTSTLVIISAGPRPRIRYTRGDRGGGGDGGD